MLVRVGDAGEIAHRVVPELGLVAQRVGDGDDVAQGIVGKGGRVLIGVRCPTAEADIAGFGLVVWSVLRDGGTSDEEDSEFESSSRRAHFASLEPN